MSEPIKLAIVGLSRVGKTSIYKKCFEDCSIEDIKKSLPTIMISQNLVNVDHVSKGISIWDFGGQESFRSAYLKNPKYFDETRIIIFVIDVFEIRHLHEAEDYFQSILNIFGNKKKPNIFVFLHKCDPDKKELVQDNIAQILLTLNNTFEDGVPYYLTSIYDNSLCRSMNTVLFLSLPEDVLSRIFTKEIFHEIKKSINEKTKDPSPDKILEISQVFGYNLSKKLLDSWAKSSLKKIDKKKKDSKIFNVVEIVYEEKCQTYNFSCKGIIEGKRCTEMESLIMEGIFKGVLNSLHLEIKEITKVCTDEECLMTFRIKI